MLFVPPTIVRPASGGPVTLPIDTPPAGDAIVIVCVDVSTTSENDGKAAAPVTTTSPARTIAPLRIAPAEAIAIGPRTAARPLRSTVPAAPTARACGIAATPRLFANRSVPLRTRVAPA